MAAPKTRQQVRSFPWFSQLLQGVVARRSDISASLARFTSTKVPFKWTKVEDEDFHKLNSAMSKETMLNYPNYSKELKIHLV